MRRVKRGCELPDTTLKRSDQRQTQNNFSASLASGGPSVSYALSRSDGRTVEATDNRVTLSLSGPCIHRITALQVMPHCLVTYMEKDSWDRDGKSYAGIKVSYSSDRLEPLAVKTAVGVNFFSTTADGVRAFVPLLLTWIHDHIGPNITSRSLICR